jgi:hypothetical protein
MTTINKPNNLIPFLFMGCWNRDAPPRASVADAIRENPIKTLILGGDNVYPEKIKLGDSTDFTKVYSLKTLMNGVHMLHGKDIYTALGNHNVSEPILKTELGLTEWTIPNRYYSVNFRDHTLIVIDTNLIETDKYDEMRSWLLEQVRKVKEDGKQYYYVQHEPFISFKKKKITTLPKSADILGILKEYPPIAILCADTHNYQKGILEIGDVKIKQYIVGTGGADPDIVKTEIGASHTSDGVKYTMKKYTSGYGYLEVTNEKTKFIKVEDWRPFEGKGGKRSDYTRSDYKRSDYKRKTHKKRKSSHYVKKSRKHLRK